MLLFILVSCASAWTILGLAIASNGFNVARMNLACDLLRKNLSRTLEWHAFVRTSKESALPSRQSLFMRALILGPGRILVCILILTILTFAALVLPSAKVAAMARASARSVLYTLGLSLRVTGYKSSACIAPCVVSNHVSAMDILVFLSLGASFVANEAVLRIPGIGRIAKSIGCMFVERDSPDSRTAAREAIRLHFMKMDRSIHSPQLVIFPEGTTTNGKGLLLFRRGAFISGVKVQPARVVYRNKQCSMSLLNLWELVCLLCVLPRSEVTVTYLPSVEGRTGENGPGEMAEICRSRIASVKGEELLELYERGSHRDEKTLTEFIVNSIALID